MKGVTCRRAVGTSVNGSRQHKIEAVKRSAAQVVLLGRWRYASNNQAIGNSVLAVPVMIDFARLTNLKQAFIGRQLVSKRARGQVCHWTGAGLAPTPAVTALASARRICVT